MILFTLELTSYSTRLHGDLDAYVFALKLNTFSFFTTHHLNILSHDRDSLGMNGAQVGILKQGDQVCIAGFLPRHDCRVLEAQISLKVLSDFTDHVLEGLED